MLLISLGRETAQASEIHRFDEILPHARLPRRRFLKTRSGAHTGERRGKLRSLRAGGFQKFAELPQSFFPLIAVLGRRLRRQLFGGGPGARPIALLNCLPEHVARSLRVRAVWE